MGLREDSDQALLGLYGLDVLPRYAAYLEAHFIRHLEPFIGEGHGYVR
jgi:hypothetical protein